MAVAAWLIWRQSESHSVRLPLTLFAIQLVLNVAWSAIFFHYHRVGLAFVEVIILWIFIFSTTVAFRDVSRAASWLMVPYLAWVTYASTLNAGIWRLNE